METEVVQPLAIDPAILTPIVRKATGREDLLLEDWQMAILTGGIERGSAILRLTGGGISAGENIDWSIILKIIRPGPGNNSTPQASHYWQREPLYYQSGIFDQMPDDFRSPHCYAVLEQSDGYWLFLEDVTDRHDQSQSDHGWPFEYYHTVARCLGRFNGTYLVSKPNPVASWIPTQWLRAYIEEATQNVDLCFHNLENPIFKRAFTKEYTDILRRAWNERYLILEALDSLPQVFCHQDPFCRNLFAQLKQDGSEQLVAIDWSYAGSAPLGTDLSVLVNASLGLCPMTYELGGPLKEITLDGYMQGLEDAGWTGNPDLIRFSLAAVGFWRYTLAAVIGEGTPAILDEKFHPLLVQAFNVSSIDALADHFASGIPWYTKLYEDTHQLKKILKL